MSQRNDKHARVAVTAALLLGLALRLWWIWRFGQTTTDGHIYGEFARNWLEHGVYGFASVAKGVTLVPQPSLIRLPGYPLFLAICFKLFGTENYIAVMVVQAGFDLWTCWLLGASAKRLFGHQAGFAALWLSALCPFLANYVAAPLTETLTLWCIAAAFYAMLRWREAGANLNRWVFAIGSALAYAVLLRPEQGLLAAAVVPGMAAIAFRTSRWKALPPVLLAALLTVLPLVPWTARNWQTFHVFQPLAPRFATDPGERINYGFQRWYRTWAVEFASTETVYWNYDGQPVLIADLPTRAFDSNAQYAETEAVLANYNEANEPTPELDAQFNHIAAERIAADPFRYYVVLPVARVLNMMFRPRTEMLPVPVEWWRFGRYWRSDVFSVAYAGLNFAFFALAALGYVRPRARSAEDIVVWTMLATIVLRTALLLTIDNSEPRYTLEFYPVLIILGAAACQRSHRSGQTRPQAGPGR
jgi:4-amino-4-deoxy-L-arabinose transferase-like glycosyltransferase